MTYHYGMGALEVSDQIGVAKYKVTGDPVIALLAQLNRFANKSVQAGPACGSRFYVPKVFPLTRMLPFAAANQAHLIIAEMATCAPIGTRDAKLVHRLAAVDNVVGWVTENINDVTIKLAQLGDSLGLAAAVAGITKVDESLTPKFPTGLFVLVGVGLGFAYILKRRQS